MTNIICYKVQGYPSSHKQRKSLHIIKQGRTSQNRTHLQLLYDSQVDYTSPFLSDRERIHYTSPKVFGCVKFPSFLPNQVWTKLTILLITDAL